MNKTPKLRFKEFSGDWESKKLHQVSDVLSGKRAPKGMNLVEYNTGIPYITVSDMGDKYVDLNKLKYITPKIEECIKKYKVLENDIIISVAGTLGKINLIQSELENANLTENCDKITNLKNANYKYLYYYLNTEYIQNQISSVNTISSQPKLALACIRDFNISIPDLKEQEKIASLFSLIDDKISLQGEKLEILKDYKKGMMQKIFSRELRFKDDNGRDYPEWEEKNLAKIVSKKKKGQNAIYVEEGNILLNNDYMENNTDPMYVENEIDVNPKDILILWDGSQAGKMYTGFTGVLGSTFLAITLDKYNCNRFIYQQLIYNLEKIQTAWREGSGVPHVAKDFIENFKIEVPVLEEQIKISKVLDGIDVKLKKEKDKLDYLNEYKKGLLQQMFV